jgi:hypothetical protein
MKLRDILREIEDEEGDGMKRTYLQYDLAIQPVNLQAAIDALKDKANYGIYSKNLTDRSNIEKIFGPSNPNQKEGAAKKDWASLDVIAKKGKIQDIIKRNPSNWGNIKSKLEIEDDKQAIEKLSSMSFEEIKPTGIFGSKSVEYYPTKTADNMKEYGGVMVNGLHYIIEDDKIIFPQKVSPYNSKQYLEKVISTIMDNANIGYEIINVERTEDTPEKTEPEIKTIKAIEFRDIDSYVADDIKSELKLKYPNLTASILKSEDSDNILIKIKGFKNNSERAKVQGEVSNLINTLMESRFKKIMQVKAGIIK